MHGGMPSSLRPVAGVLVTLLLLAWASTPTPAQGVLQRLRDDVRESPDLSSSFGSSKRRDDDGGRFRFHCGSDGCGHDDERGFCALAGEIVVFGLTSPWSAPHAALEDGRAWHDSLYFPRFPYDHVPGYMMCDPCEAWDDDPACAVDPLRADKWPARPRTWAGRLRMEYADEFNDVTRISRHLLLSTRSRFGLDTETSYLEEQLPDGTQDELWLGEAELFRLRTTGGVLVYGVEVYTGYEYLDIDTTQMNTIMGGVRIWF